MKLVIKEKRDLIKFYELFYNKKLNKNEFEYVCLEAENMIENNLSAVAEFDDSGKFVKMHHA